MRFALIKKVASMVLACLLFVLALNITVLADDIQVKVNGTTLQLVNMPVNLNGATLIPISEVLGGMGYSSVFWDSKTKELTMGNNNAQYANKIVITNGKSNFMYNGKAQSLGGAATMINNVMYTTPTAIMSAIGHKVLWAGNAIIIYNESYLNSLLKSSLIAIPGSPGIKNMNINGIPIQFVHEPLYMNGKIYVPIAELLGKMGYEYVWFHSGQEITIGNNSEQNSNKYVIKRWQSKFTYNGKSYNLDGTATTIDNIMYTPVTNVVSVIGYKVAWFDEGVVIYDSDYANSLLKK